MAENLRNKISQNFFKGHRPLASWNARSASGTRKAPLERPPALERPKSPGTARRANGTRKALLEQPEGQMERAKRLWNARRAILCCLLAGDIISVLIRSALRRSAPSGTRKALLERPLAYWNRAYGSTWNALRASGTASGHLERPQGVSKKPLLHTRYTRNRGGYVEQSWCFRGERFSFREEERRSAVSLRPGMRLSLAIPSPTIRNPI